MHISVQSQDFDAGAEIARLRQQRPDAGAVVAFVGQVRDLSENGVITDMTLEHYPGMTEKSLRRIADEVMARWPVFDLCIIHRIGRLRPTDQIVLVVVGSAHRGEAFAACEFIMDYLKTAAPFWKKEQTPSGACWVDAKSSDDAARARWDVAAERAD